MPTELSSLTELQVLKGFVIGTWTTKSCTLEDLGKLKKLRKLNIYTGKLDPTNPEDKTDEEKEKGNEGEPDTAAASQENQAASEKPVLFAQLEKLDLQCFPHMKAPSWLTPSNLKNVKKLYIGGGKLSHLSQFHQGKNEETVAQQEKAKWTIKRLRLKYLSELEMDWKEMRELFPELIYLETMKCPKLAFFPCNESGMWINKKKI
ncbi:hypothetical protein F0562_018987 [Nyssa sinensis]|uniref:NB-ARC domain-containing protein n=1 Tax=Nyssa sinensis TaxID=561372 RepID=A0A5J4ZC92_9ASTE|nr:hypothetical protein F0562_018987 [Nyssa sinensis]